MTPPVGIFFMASPYIKGAAACLLIADTRKSHF
jgi:hypothetical protein